MRKILPRGEQVLINPMPSTPRGASISDSSRIIMADATQEPSRTGEVLAVGPGRWVPGTWWFVLKGWMPEWVEFPGKVHPPSEIREWEWIPGYWERPEVKPGDMVLFPRYAGVEFVRGEDAEEFVGLRLMKESDIILKIERN